MGYKVFMNVSDELLIDRCAKSLANYYLGRTKGTYVALMKEEMYTRPSLVSFDTYGNKYISSLVWEIVKERAKVIQEDIEKQERG